MNQTRTSVPRAEARSVLARAATLLATVLVGLSAGFFFAYEASVTVGLAEVGDRTYVETFQAINQTIRNPAFGIVFFGSIPSLIAALILNWRSGSVTVRALLVAALGSYGAGLLVTVTGNVPLNDELAAVTGSLPAVMSAARSAFEDDWNRLNLLRSVAFGVGFLVLAAVPFVPTGPPESEPDQELGQNR